MHVLVMELCCTDLAAALDHAKIGWDEVLIRGLLRQLLQGVAACHNTGPAPDTLPNLSPCLPGSLLAAPQYSSTSLRNYGLPMLTCAYALMQKSNVFTYYCAGEMRLRAEHL